MFLCVIPGPERSEGTFGTPRNDGGSIQREWKLLKHAGQTTRGYGGALFGTAARR